MKRFRKFVIVCLSAGILVSLIFLHPYFNGKHKLLNYYHHLVWGDVLEVDIQKGVDPNKISIVFKNEQCLYEERFPDTFSLAERHGQKSMHDTIFKSGKQVAEIPYDYGKQILQVLYEGKQIGRLHHWQTNSYHSHRYYIQLRLEKNDVKYTGYLTGPDANFPQR